VNGVTPSRAHVFTSSRLHVFTSSPYWLSLAVLLAALTLSIALGAVGLPLLDVVRVLVARLSFGAYAPGVPETTETILLDIRLPRAALVLLTGAALGGSGAAYQGLFRNPLADPYLIGVASGRGWAPSPPWPYSGLRPCSVSRPCGRGLRRGADHRGYRVPTRRVGRTTPVTTLLLAGVATGRSPRRSPRS